MPDAVVVLPAGARDHYLAAPGARSVLIAPGQLVEAIGGGSVISVDMDTELLGAAAAAAGAAAIDAMPQALLAMARERLASDATRTRSPSWCRPTWRLPRGVRRAAEDLGWSPDLR